MRAEGRLFVVRGRGKHPSSTTVLGSASGCRSRPSNSQERAAIPGSSPCKAVSGEPLRNGRDGTSLTIPTRPLIAPFCRDASQTSSLLEYMNSFRSAVPDKTVQSRVSPLTLSRTLSRRRARTSRWALPSTRSGTRRRICLPRIVPRFSFVANARREPPSRGDLNSLLSRYNIAPDGLGGLSAARAAFGDVVGSSNRRRTAGGLSRFSLCDRTTAARNFYRLKGLSGRRSFRPAHR